MENKGHDSADPSVSVTSKFLSGLDLHSDDSREHNCRVQLLYLGGQRPSVRKTVCGNGGFEHGSGGLELRGRTRTAGVSWRGYMTPFHRQQAYTLRP